MRPACREALKVGALCIDELLQHTCAGLTLLRFASFSVLWEVTVVTSENWCNISIILKVLRMQLLNLSSSIF